MQHATQLQCDVVENADDGLDERETGGAPSLLNSLIFGNSFSFNETLR